MGRGIVDLYEGACAAGGAWRNPPRNSGEGRAGDGDCEGGGGDAEVISSSRDNPREALRVVSEGEAVVLITGSRCLPSPSTIVTWISRKSGAFSVFYAAPRGGGKGESIKRKEKEEEIKKKREEEEEAIGKRGRKKKKRRRGMGGGEEGALAYQVRPNPPFLKNNRRFFWFALFCFFFFSCT